MCVNVQTYAQKVGPLVHTHHTRNRVIAASPLRPLLQAFPPFFYRMCATPAWTELVALKDITAARVASVRVEC